MTEKPHRFDLDSYLLGFWVADGAYSKGRLRFLINQRDKAILDLFCAHYGGTRSEYAYNNGISYYSVPAARFAEPLQRANISLDKQTAKTGKILFAGKDEFLSFLLGFVDGDGSISAPSFHHSTRISMIAESREFLECLSAGTSTFSCIEGRLVGSKQKYHQLIYGRANAYNLAHSLLPYLVGFRKHKLIADIAENYDYDWARNFHSKLDETAYSEMVLLRQQGLIPIVISNTVLALGCTGLKESVLAGFPARKSVSNATCSQRRGR
jgi:hypothetical protein